jgi:hypothetical protein
MPKIHERHDRFVVVSSSAKMPSSVMSPYRHVAVVETEQPGDSVPMISTRAKTIRKVVREWRNLNVGKTGASAFGRALSDACTLAFSESLRDHARKLADQESAR